MKTNDFIRKAKQFTIYANILPKGNHRMYATPLLFQYTINTMRFVLMARIMYDETELVIYDYQGTQPYLTIDYSEVTALSVSAAMRIVSAGRFPGQQFDVVLRIQCSQGDFEIETCDEDHALMICKYIHNQGVKIFDPYKITKIMIKTKNEPHGFYEYMIEHFSDIAKEHGLECPAIEVSRRIK